MTKDSAGIVMFRRRASIEVLLVHPGGPFFARRDDGVWSIPKGLPNTDEDLLSAAKREFREETGISAPPSGYVELGMVQQTNKRVHAWAFEGDFDPTNLISNTFELEWPPRSGQRRSFPEVDRADFFTLEAAQPKIIAAQMELLERLAERLDPAGRPLA